MVGALCSLSSHTVTLLSLSEIQNSDYKMSFAAMGCELKESGLLKYNGLLKYKSKGSEMTSGE